jgi:inward rectifier potassium channel
MSDASENQEHSQGFEDLGFGSKAYGRAKRLINKDGSFSIRRTHNGWEDLHLYQWLVLMSWPRFLLMIVGFYLLLNTLFALGYLAVGIDQLSADGLDLHPFWIAFFFSVQTLTTVGYGSVSPCGLGANILAATGALVGLLSFALATGLLFARFSKARVSLLFSENALIAPYKDKKALMFRMVNRRRNILSDVQVIAMLSWVEEDQQGTMRRQFRTLPLERTQLPMMPLNWTVVHPIDANSPMYRWTEEVCEKLAVELVIVLQAYDDTFSNKVKAYQSYKWNEFIWNAKFVPMFYADEDGETVLELEKLGKYQKLKGKI